MTQTDGSKLPALLERIEAAEGPSRELDAAIDAAFPPADPKERWCGCTGACKPDHPNYAGACVAVPHHTDDLDACAALQARVLPGWNWHLSKEDEGPWAPRAIAAVNTKPVWDDATEDYIPKRAANAPGATPALAWLAAIVRALIAKHKGGTDGPGQA